MAQNFSMRYILVDGQGNFGSVDGDAPAAMRYTEVRMTRIAQELLADIDKKTVDFSANYDESEFEPTVLPTRIPNLLVNGSSGIAVGMATNIPPHNLGEIVDGCLALLASPDLTVADLIELIPGPDFPTAGLIFGSEGIASAYSTGRGRVYMRARVEIEPVDARGKEAIIITELPYQVNKARLIEKIAELVRDKRLEGITELRDESDKDGMRVVIELRRGELTEVVINNLYKQTQLQSVFGINMVGLIDGQPKLLGLKALLQAFLRHRREVITRRTIFELRKAKQRAHILEGQTVALANIDEVIKLIKKSASAAEAKVGLLSRDWSPGAVVDMLKRAGAEITRPEDLDESYGLNETGYRLSPAQAQAILELRLHRLTALEQDGIHKEYKGLSSSIEDLYKILEDSDQLQSVIKTELLEVREQYADPRRTEIVEDLTDLTNEDLIPREDLVVTLSHGGYVKAQPLSDYNSQHRGGRGKTATKVKDEDFIDKVFVANSHDTLLCFSSRGKVYWLKVYQLPRASAIARGRPIVNLLPLEKEERINTLLPIKDYAKDKFVLFATSHGTVKKTPLEAFSNRRASGIIAIELRENDRLIGAGITDGQQDLMLFSSSGKAIKFSEKDVRAMGRTAAGVRGLRLGKVADTVIALCIPEGEMILIATEHGYGKRTTLGDFPSQGRGGKGVIAIQVSDRNGPVVGAVQVTEQDEVMLISSSGILVRTASSEISIIGRNTQGVRLIKLGDKDRLVGLERIEILPEQDLAD
jgi:DNA gyrase subunit A